MSTGCTGGRSVQLLVRVLPFWLTLQLVTYTANCEVKSSPILIFRRSHSRVAWNGDGKLTLSSVPRSGKSLQLSEGRVLVTVSKGE